MKVTNLEYIITIVLILSLWSCRNTERFPANIKYLECLNCNEPPSEEFTDYDVIDIIKLETTSSCLINEIIQVECIDSLIIALDFDRSLFVFDHKGAFKNKIGEKGEGPDQYITLNTFFIDQNKNVVIIDEMKNRFLTYTLEGEYLNTIKISVTDIRYSRQAVPFEKDLLLVSNMMNMDNNMAYSLFDRKENKLLGDFFTYDPITTNNYLYSFSNHPIARLEDDISLSFIMPLCDTIYTYSDFAFHAKYAIRHPFKMARKEQISIKSPSYTKDIIDLNRNGFFTGFTAIYETMEHILLEFKHQGLIVGYFLFDKKQQTGNYFLYSTPPVKSKIPFFRIIGSARNSLIATVNSDYLLQLELESDSQEEINVKFENILAELKEDDNPILFFYRLKNN